MKSHSITHLFKVSLAIMPLMAFAPKASAQLDATAWTSVEGTTIWARLDGMDGNLVLLHMRGRTYRVPVARLSAKSIEKLGMMLGEMHTTRERLPRRERDRAAVDPRSVVAGVPGNPGATGRVPENSQSFDGRVPAPNSPPNQNRHSHPTVRMAGRVAIAPCGVPERIQTALEAGNRLQKKSYKWGGGRASLEDTGYDCSGSVSYVLIKAGMLESPLSSRGFATYGAPGPGRWITIHASPGHVFMTICGLRLDTSGHGERGPRWRFCGCRPRGTVVRHPPGF